MNTTSTVSRLAIGFTLFFISITGCGQADVEKMNAATPASLREDYVINLVDRYKADEPDLKKQDQILQEVMNLRGDEARLFNNELRRRQPKVDEGLEWLVEALIAHANERGVTTVSIPPAESKQLYQELIMKHNANQPPVTSSPTSLLWCLPGQVRCAAVEFRDWASGGSCGSGCASATGSDRVSNEECEWAACDHRIWFPTSRNTLASRSSETRCVILKAGGLISRYDGRREVLSGISSPFECGIYYAVNDHLRNNLLIF